MNVTDSGRMIWWAMPISGQTERKRKGKKRRKRKGKPLATLADARRKRR